MPGSGARSFAIGGLGGLALAQLAGAAAILGAAIGVAGVGALWWRPGRVRDGSCTCDTCFVRVTAPSRSAEAAPPCVTSDELSAVVAAGCGDRLRDGDLAVTLALRAPRTHWRGVVNPAPDQARSRWGRRCLAHGRRAQLMMEYIMGPASVRYITLGAHHAALVGHTAAWLHFEAVLLPPVRPSTLSVAATLADSLGLVGAYQAAVCASGAHDEAAAGFPTAAVVFSDVLVVR